MKTTHLQGGFLTSPVAPDYIAVQMPECARAWKALADNLKQKMPEEEAAQKKYKKQRKEVETRCIDLLVGLSASNWPADRVCCRVGIAGD